MVGRFFVQKSPGEIKRSLLMLFFMFAAVITVAWGIFGKPHIAAASILMWGMGDASLIDKSQFKLLNVSDEVKEILETTGFDQFLL